MSLSDDDKQNLLQEMKLLAFRYGEHNCQDVINAVKISSSPLIVPMMTLFGSHGYHPSYRFSSGALQFGFDKLMRWVDFEDCGKKISISFNADTPSPSDIVPFLTTLERYHDAILYLQSAHSSSGNHRIESQFHTLTLNGQDRETNEKILESKNSISLFDKVVLCGYVSNVQNDSIMSRIKELVVNEGVISALKVTQSSLCDKDFFQFGRMVEANFLESIEIDFSSQVLAYILTSSFKVHTQVFAEKSTFRVLDLGKTLEGLDWDLRRDLFAVIGTLPHLETFGISSTDCSLLGMLAERIGTWKIRRFKLLARFIETTFQPLFDAIATSRNLMVFSFGCIATDGAFPLDVYRQIVNLALSPASGLIEIDVHTPHAPHSRTLFDLPELSTLVSKDIDPNLAARRQLRRFNCVPWPKKPKIDQGVNRVLANSPTLVRLLSKQLPYLHYIGFTRRDWTLYAKDHAFKDEMKDKLRDWDQVWVQMELNQVGMALFQPGVCSPVPGGVWPRVLSTAITGDPDASKVPWTGIYKMVRKLILEGHTGWTDGPLQFESLECSIL